MLTEFFIYTDGSCVGAPGQRTGGWAAWIQETGHDPVTLHGGEPIHTTNNRMELLAPIRALEWLLEKKRLATASIQVFTDSEYVANNFHRVPQWKRLGWMTISSPHRESVPVTNPDLWEELDRLGAMAAKFAFHHIARSSTAENQLCDRLAREAAESA